MVPSWAGFNPALVPNRAFSFEKHLPRASSFENFENVYPSPGALL